jgi:hypothetical protein
MKSEKKMELKEEDIYEVDVEEKNESQLDDSFEKMSIS